MTITLIIILVAFGTGIFAGVLFSIRPARKEVSFLQEKLDSRNREYDLLLSERDKLRLYNTEVRQKADKAEASVEFLKAEQQQYFQLKQLYAEGQQQLAILKTRLEQATALLETQKADVQQLQEQNQKAFRVMAEEILAEKERKFEESNQKHMQQLLNPLREQLTDFKRKVEDVYVAESKERHTLKTEIQRLVETSTKVGIEANNLTNALKTDVKKQGNWGEWILETILENSGLVKDREFFMQQFIRDKAGNVIKDEDGKGLQPDATILYPDARKVLADSKVSLVAWERYVNATTEAEQQQQLEAHIASLYAHVDGLSAKNYPKYAEALDYILMFVPVEPAFLEALKADRDLWKYAYDRGIVMVSPTNLLAVLKIIGDLWRVEKQSKHAIEIAEKAGGLYDKFHGFISTMELVGKKLSEGQEAYEKAFRQLSSGSGNIIRRIEELKKMGAKAAKQLPDQLLSDIEDENSNNETAQDS